MSSWHCSSHAVRPRVGIKAVIIWPKLAQKQSWVGLVPVILRPIKVGIEAVMSWQNEYIPVASVPPTETTVSAAKFNWENKISTLLTVVFQLAYVIDSIK